MLRPDVQVLEMKVKALMAWMPLEQPSWQLASSWLPPSWLLAS